MARPDAKPLAGSGTAPVVPRPGHPLTKVVVNLAVPSGGYVFTQGGRLRVDDPPRSIVELDASLECVGQLVLAGIPVAADGRFSAVRTSPDNRAIAIHVRGVFVRHGVHLSLLATGAGCEGRKVELVGALS